MAIPITREEYERKFGLSPSGGAVRAPLSKPPKKPNTILDNPVTRGIQTIFPGKKVGESIGTLGGFIASPNKEQYDLSAPSPLQVGGDVVQGAAQVVGMKGAGTVGKFGSKALKSAGIGATMFGGKTAAEGGGGMDIVKSAALGGVVGGGISAVASGAEGALANFKKVPERLIRSATGQSKKEILAGKGLEKFMIENRKIGTADNLIRDSKAHMEKLSEYINQNLKSVPITKAKVTTSSLLNDIVKDVNSQGGAITKAEAREIIDRLAPQAKGLLNKPSMSLVTANKLRQSIDRTIGDKGFLSAELPFNKDILRSFTNALREEVKSKAPEGTRAAFNSLSNEIRMSNALANKVAKGSTNQIVSFGDLIGAGIGGAIGSVPGAAIGAGARRAIQSTPFLTGAAVGIDALNKTLQPLMKGISPTVQTQIMNAVSNFVAPRDKGNQPSQIGEIINETGGAIKQGLDNLDNKMLGPTSERNTPEGRQRIVDMATSFGPGAVGSIEKKITPEVVAKMVDGRDLQLIRDYLMKGSLKSFNRLASLFEETGIDNLSYDELNRFLEKVVSANTKKLPIGTGSRFLKGAKGLFSGSKKKQ